MLQITYFRIWIQNGLTGIGQLYFTWPVGKCVSYLKL